MALVEPSLFNLLKKVREVILNYRRSKTECEAVLQEIADLGGVSIAIRADVGNEDKTNAMFEVIESEYGRLDILIANASFGIPGNILDATNKHWDVTINSTSRSIFHCALRSADLMNRLREYCYCYQLWRAACSKWVRCCWPC